jgi:hypothetical protein
LKKAVADWIAQSGAVKPTSVVQFSFHVRQAVAVVTVKENNGVFIQIICFELVNNVTDLLVQVDHK